jgi:hypothetical protein
MRHAPILQKLADTALALCRAHAAGLSLLEEDPSLDREASRGIPVVSAVQSMTRPRLLNSLQRTYSAQSDWPLACQPGTPPFVPR